VTVHEERRAAFWREVAGHPDVAPLVGPTTVEAWIDHPGVLPMACEHGGWIAVRMDALGLVHELHAMMTPAGRGRDSHAVCIALLLRLFASGAQLITAQEQAANRFSRAPLSFGFRPQGPFVETLIGPVRLWSLTRQAWERSPACRRLE
jgi:hypothetical protein